MATTNKGSFDSLLRFRLADGEEVGLESITRTAHEAATTAARRAGFAFLSCLYQGEDRLDATVSRDDSPQQSETVLADLREALIEVSMLAGCTGDEGVEISIDAPSVPGSEGSGGVVYTVMPCSKPRQSVGEPFPVTGPRLVCDTSVDYLDGTHSRNNDWSHDGGTVLVLSSSDREEGVCYRRAELYRAWQCGNHESYVGLYTGPGGGAGAHAGAAHDDGEEFLGRRSSHPYHMVFRMYNTGHWVLDAWGTLTSHPRTRVFFLRPAGQYYIGSLIHSVGSMHGSEKHTVYELVPVKTHDGGNGGGNGDGGDGVSRPAAPLPNFGISQRSPLMVVDARAGGVRAPPRETVAADGCVYMTPHAMRYVQNARAVLKVAGDEEAAGTLTPRAYEDYVRRSLLPDGVPAHFLDLVATELRAIGLGEFMSVFAYCPDVGVCPTLAVRSRAQCLRATGGARPDMGVPYHVPDAPLMPDMFRPHRERDGFVTPAAVRSLETVGREFVVRDQREEVLARSLYGGASYYVRALIDPEQALSPRHEVDYIRAVFASSGFRGDEAARVVRANSSAVMLMFFGRRARALSAATTGIKSYDDLARVAFEEEGEGDGDGDAPLAWRSDKARRAYENGLATQTECPLSYMFMVRRHHE